MEARVVALVYLVTKGGVDTTTSRTTSTAWKPGSKNSGKHIVRVVCWQNEQSPKMILHVNSDSCVIRHELNER